MKKQFIFKFVDSPKIYTIETRERVAKMLRAYRSNSRLFRLERIEAGYRVTAGLSVAEIVEAA